MTTMRVSLIGTYHQERGAVTIDALLAILERLKPEIIFAETPLTHIDAWRDGSHGTLESIAVARYAAINLIEVVPVDLPKPEQSFFRDYEEMTRAIERTSPAFRHLMDLNTDRTLRDGFAYLNSDECIQAWTSIYLEELDTLEYMRNPRLREIHQRVRATMENRDKAMLSSIREFCANSHRARGAFLVGAAHRGSLIEKILVNDGTTSDGIEWDLGGPGRPSHEEASTQSLT